MVEIIKKILKQSTLGRLAYEPIHQIYRFVHKPIMLHRMRQHGYEVLERVHEVFKNNNIPYACEAGTLLGFLRDGGFIKNDDDFDFVVFPEYGSLSKALKIFLAADYKYVQAFDFRGRMVEFTIIDPKVNLPIDVFQYAYVDEEKERVYARYMRWYEGRQYPSDTANTVLEFNFVAAKGVRDLSVHGVNVHIPGNAEEVLDSEYGSWRKPDPNFKSEAIKHIELHDYAMRLTEAEALNHE